MKWFKNLLSNIVQSSSTGKNYNKQNKPSNIKYYGSNSITIRSEDLVGRYKKSPNNQFTLVLSDNTKTADGGRGGYRESGEGRFALLDHDDNILYILFCERPVKGSVADNGTAVVIDTHFGQNTESTALIYNQFGELLLDIHSNANTLGVSISSTGRYITVYSDKLHLIDVDKKTIITSFSPETGAGNHWLIDEDKKIISIQYSQTNRTYSYDFNGNFLDSEQYEIERIEDAWAGKLVLIVREKLATSTAEQLPGLLDIIDLAFERGFYSNGSDKEYLDYKASAYRLRGEISEQLGMFDNAIESYKAALEIDPKIGVKRNLKALEKKLNS